MINAHQLVSDRSKLWTLKSLSHEDQMEQALVILWSQTSPQIPLCDWKQRQNFFRELDNGTLKILPVFVLKVHIQCFFSCVYGCALAWKCVCMLAVIFITCLHSLLCTVSGCSSSPFFLSFMAQDSPSLAPLNATWPTDLTFSLQCDTQIEGSNFPFLERMKTV